MKPSILLFFLATFLTRSGSAQISIGYTIDNCSPAVLHFTSSVPGTHLWHYGDGTYEIADNPTHTFYTSDTFYVRVYLDLYWPSGMGDDSGHVTLITTGLCSSLDHFVSLTGHIYRDTTTDCNFSGTEPTFAYGGLRIESQSNIYGVITDSNGFYQIYLPVDTAYKIISFLPPDAILSCPGSDTTYYTPLDTIPDIVDIAYTVPTLLNTDLTINSTGVCLGTFDTALVCVYATSSKICTDSAISVSLHLDPALHYASTCSSYIGPSLHTFPEPDIISGNQVIWNINSDWNYFVSCMFVYSDGSLAVGDPFCDTAYITQLSIDTVTSNNSSTMCFTYGAPYDPNLKTVIQGSGIEGFISNGTSLTYIINYQNTGTDTAMNVVVTDTLSDNIDAASFQLVNSDHPVIVNHIGQALKFTFPGINLPDSNVNEPASHGSFMYSIKLRSDLPAGSEIKNTANIYFDSNAPVATNTTLNTIGEAPASVQVYPHYIPAVYPNPASTDLFIEITAVNSEYVIMTMMGQIIYAGKLATGKNVIQVNDLAPGMYLMLLSNGKESSAVRFVKH